MVRYDIATSQNTKLPVRIATTWKKESWNSAKVWQSHIYVCIMWINYMSDRHLNSGLLRSAWYSRIEAIKKAASTSSLHADYVDLIVIFSQQNVCYDQSVVPFNVLKICLIPFWPKRPVRKLKLCHFVLGCHNSSSACRISTFVTFIQTLTRDWHNVGSVSRR